MLSAYIFILILISHYHRSKEIIELVSMFLQARFFGKINITKEWGRGRKDFQKDLVSIWKKRRF